MRVSHVFIPGGLPSLTYIPRNNLELEKKFKDYLEYGNKILSLSGPTKSGKTVLCRRSISNSASIWIEGGNIREEKDFWQIIIDELGIFTDVSTTTKEETSGATESHLNGELSAVVAKVSGELAVSEGKTAGQEWQWSKSVNPRIVALNWLKKYPIKIIVDDFHYIPQDIQRNLIRSLKGAIFDGLRFVAITVPHRAYDPNKMESEMTGRVQQMNIPPWNIDELIEIPRTGFPLLNIEVSETLIHQLAEECFGNPQLMQEFCAELCKSNNIIETSPSLISFPNTINDSFFENIAKEVASKPDYEMLANGPRPRTDRIQRELMGGQIGDIYKAVLMAMANTGPKLEISYIELRTELRSVLKGDTLQASQISRVLAQMEKISSGAEGRPRTLEWDNKLNKLYILDPYFAFYLRWIIRKKSPSI